MAGFGFWPTPPCSAAPIVVRVGPKRDALRMARRQQQQPRHAVPQRGQRPRHVVRVVRQLGLGRVRQGELGWVVLGRSVGQRQCAQRKLARPGEDQGQRQRALPRRPGRPGMGVRRFLGRQLLLLRRRDAVVENNPVNARYTVANVVATKTTGRGAAKKVVVYEDALESMRI